MRSDLTLRVAGRVQDSIVDGPGLRYALFVQGCPYHCEGCHNQKTWDFDGGEEFTPEQIIEEIRSNPLLTGLTLSGGEPACQAAALLPVARFAKQSGLDIWIWSGNTFEKLLELNDPDVLELLRLCDVLVDGPFILAQRTLALEWRGSKNQRLVDLPKSLAVGRYVEYRETSYGDEFEVPRWG